MTNYDQMILNDAQTSIGGGFVETQITTNLKLPVAVGYQKINFDNTGLVKDPNDLDDYYANAFLSHRVNSVLTHTIAAGHETQLGVNSNYITLNYIRHTANWNILYHTLLSTELFYEDAEESGGGSLLLPPGGFLCSIPSRRNTSTDTVAP